MKNKLFILICFIFIFGFNMDVWAAPKLPKYYFIVDNYDEDEDLFRALCGIYGGPGCDVWDKKEGFIGSNIADYFIPISTSKVGYFSIDGHDKDASDLAKFLEGHICSDSKTNNNCLVYVKNNYCNSHGKEDICVGLFDENSGAATHAKCDNGVCTCSFPASYNGGYQGDSLTFEITFDEDDVGSKKFGIYPLYGVSGLFDYNESEGFFRKNGNTFYLYPKNGIFDDLKNMVVPELEKRIKNLKSGELLDCTNLLTFCCDKKDNGTTDTSTFYMVYGDSCPSSTYGMCKQTLGSDDDIVLEDPGEQHYTGDLIKNGGVWKSLSCSDIIPEGSKTQELLKTIINMIKIAVPVLLLVFGVIDFGSAIFAQEEGNIKKAQGKFIKRLIIAVIIFLIPSILNVILSIAHTVWPNISPDFCGIL